MFNSTNHLINETNSIALIDGGNHHRNKGAICKHKVPPSYT